MFNVALAAWRVGGHPERFVPQVACSGTRVKGQLAQWTGIARGDAGLELYLTRLYEAFEQAPVLGSLIDPRQLAIDTGTAHRRQEMIATLKRKDEWRTQATVFRRTPRQSRDALAEVVRRFGSNPGLAIFASDAEEVAQAADILSGHYDLVVTNPPFKKYSDLTPDICNFFVENHNSAKRNFATVFLERCIGFVREGGTASLVTPQDWLFLGSYERLREDFLLTRTFNVIAVIGEKGFESKAAAGADTSLVAITALGPWPNSTFLGLNASAGKGPLQKSTLLLKSTAASLSQADQEQNPDRRISTEFFRDALPLLETIADSYQGLTTGDYLRFGRFVWEISSITGNRWANQVTSVDNTVEFGGRFQSILWEGGNGTLRRYAEIARDQMHDADKRGVEAWGKAGVAVTQMRELRVSIYSGELYDTNVAVIIPKDPTHISAVWAFCSSPAFNKAVRRIDTALKVTNATLVKVPFDLEYWQKVADEKYPNGLPEPHSDDPTQWLFTGHPKGSDQPLHVALARLLGYRWPEQPEGDDGLNELADPDGIVCLPPVAGEQPAHDHLSEVLRAAYGRDWSPDTLDGLLRDAGSPGRDLETWLREDAFKQHTALFHNRPFLWHIWDGRKDGFSAIVNYHRLDQSRLNKLIYTYLGDWITRQRDDARGNVAGAKTRLDAALELQRKLELIRDGEAPYDIYVRWKSLARQPVGWEPDLNDGVRLNIRPFVEAGVLRAKFTVKWGTDRGANPAGADVYRWSEAAQRAAENRPDEINGALRLNDLHLSLATKRAARAQAEAALEVPASGQRTLVE